MADALPRTFAQLFQEVYGDALRRELERAASNRDSLWELIARENSFVGQHVAVPFQVRGPEPGESPYQIHIDVNHPSYSATLRGLGEQEQSPESARFEAQMQRALEETDWQTLGS